MDTKFTKFDENFPGWSMPFHVGTEWLQVFEILNDERKKEHGIVLFWVYPHILYFSLELFVKSLAKHENSTFNAKKDGFGHSATAIILEYKKRLSIREVFFVLKVNLVKP